jgi:dTDP-4-dehydrorhamnose reductase
MENFKSRAKRPYFTAMSNSLISSKLQIEIPSWEESLKRYCEKYDN